LIEIEKFASLTAQKKKARGEAGLWGRKALGPMRGWPQNSFLSGSLEAALLQVKKESYKRMFQ
jgi:hypothetical protein